jgi:hypothetical protein
LREVCRRERTSLHQICTSISLQKEEESSLTAAIRVFAMRYFRAASTEEGHIKAWLWPDVGHRHHRALCGSGRHAAGAAQQEQFCLAHKESMCIADWHMRVRAFSHAGDATQTVALLPLFATKMNQSIFFGIQP